MRSGYDKSSEAIGRSVGGLSTKIHAKVDSLGQLINIMLTPGQVHESQVAHDILSKDQCDYLLADKAYDIDSFRQTLAQKGTTPVIPGKKNRLSLIEHDCHIYRERNIFKKLNVSEGSPLDMIKLPECILQG
jgi:transposase